MRKNRNDAICIDLSKRNSSFAWKALATILAVAVVFFLRGSCVKEETFIDHHASNQLIAENLGASSVAEPIPFVSKENIVCLHEDILSEVTATEESADAPQGIEKPDFVTRKLENVKASHYCLCAECCGKSDGITASGDYGIPGYTIAADTEVIPMGTVVTITYSDGTSEERKVMDTGGAIHGNRIDILCGSHEEALQKGIKYVTVTWMED